MTKFYLFVMAVAVQCTLYGSIILNCCNCEPIPDEDKEKGFGERMLVVLWHVTAILVSFPIVIFWLIRIGFYRDNFDVPIIIFLCCFSLNLFFLCLFYIISFLKNNLPKPIS